MKENNIVRVGTIAIFIVVIGSLIGYVAYRYMDASRAVEELPPTTTVESTIVETNAGEADTQSVITEETAEMPITVRNDNPITQADIEYTSAHMAEDTEPCPIGAEEWIPTVLQYCDENGLVGPVYVYDVNDMDEPPEWISELEVDWFFQMPSDNGPLEFTVVNGELKTNF